MLIPTRPNPPDADAAFSVAYVHRIETPDGHVRHVCAIVTDQATGDEHIITSGDYRVLRCSCAQPHCDHLRAYRFYL